ncbi:biotin/lipoyl-containing protein [Desulfovirgula thermocuniculi]|uniref:biotin/lipoyl-containing protein n=1 Tax=Desulfovirgula thermocuniculi TaxID=348842 RepID=UPI000401CDD1|nr:biotin/lipoyl-containing protein [Desulfovirgula thermocuniculi]
MRKFKVLVNGEYFEVVVEEIREAAKPAPPPRVAPRPPLKAAEPPAKPEAGATAPASRAAEGGPGVVTAPMPGTINAVKVKVGDQVKQGDPLVILEAMKMENEIPAPVAGTVKEVRVTQGQTVNNGDVLVIIG